MRPRVGLDAQLAVGTATGIGEYVRGIAATANADDVDLVPLCAPWLDPWRFDRRVLWDQVLLPLAAARARVDVLHCASGTMPLVGTAPIVLTVLDAAWFRVQAHARVYARTYFGRIALAQVRRARRIVTISQFTRAELLSLAPIDPARIDVVPPGVADDLVRLVRAPLDQRERMVLAVGTVERRKNLAVVIRALARVPDLRLVAVGPATPYRTECEALARDCGVADRVDFRGYVSRSELLHLYARAMLAVVPSRYEGFGYGVAQALCAGVPVLLAATSSLPEVAQGDADALDPDDDPAWSRAIAAIAAEPAAAQFRADRVRARAIDRFGLGRAAAALSDVYRRAAGQ